HLLHGSEPNGSARLLAEDRIRRPLARQRGNHGKSKTHFPSRPRDLEARRRRCLPTLRATDRLMQKPRMKHGRRESLVPTVPVGTQVPTLCVESIAILPAQDAEHDVRSHGDRENENTVHRPFTLAIVRLMRSAKDARFLPS